jgi:hypothetical protein
MLFLFVLSSHHRAELASEASAEYNQRECCARLKGALWVAVHQNSAFIAVRADLAGEHNGWWWKWCVTNTPYRLSVNPHYLPGAGRRVNCISPQYSYETLS